MTAPVFLLAALMVAPGAFTPDLDSYLERSAEAEFRGETLVSCETPDGQRDAIFDIAQVDGSVVAWSSGSADPMVAVAPGRITTSAGETVEASMVEGAAPGDDVAAYETHELEDAGQFLGRDVTEVVIERDGVERLRMVVDDATEAILRTTSYTADGDEYCDRRLLSFEEGVDDVPRVEEGTADPTQPLDAAPDSLPGDAAGFTLADTYPVEDGTMSYYTDGFFSFGVVVTERPIGFGDGAEVEDVTVGGRDYRRSYEAGRVTVAWAYGDGNVALVGDLPPDLTESVIEELPEPTRRGFFGRIWDQLFGYGADQARV